MASRKLDWRDGRLDKIIAVGIASRSHDLCDALVALKYANEAAAYPAMLQAVQRMARHLNMRYRWRAEQQLAAMSKRVLDYWLSDHCRACGGVGHQHVEGAPARHHRVCGVCLGTGRRERPWLGRKLPPRLGEQASDAAQAARRKRVVDIMIERKRHDQLLEQLDRAERDVASALTWAVRGRHTGRS